MSKRMWIIILIAVAAMAAYKFWPKGADNVADPAADTLTVSTVQPVTQTLPETLRLNGKIQPRHDVVVTTELTGVRLAEVRAEVGDFVKAGQILARLDVRSQQTQLGQVQAAYDRALDEYQRVENIKDSGAISQAEVKEKQTALASAQAQLEEAKLGTARGVIRAQRAGRIYERNATAGALVNDTPLFRIIGDNQVEAVATVAEQDLGRLQVSQTAMIRVNGQTEPIEGQIRAVSPAVNQQTRSAMVFISLPDSAAFPVGVFAETEVNLGDITGATLPATAVMEDDKGAYVWVVGTSNTLARQPVTVKRRLTKNTVVEPFGNAQVVARAGAFVKAGETVNPTPEQGL
jgi:HlyD family secretion protein